MFFFLLGEKEMCSSVEHLTTYFFSWGVPMYSSYIFQDVTQVQLFFRAYFAMRHD